MTHLNPKKHKVLSEKQWLKENYYKENKKDWQKGGKYYYYRPKSYYYELTIKKGEFLLTFD